MDEHWDPEPLALWPRWLRLSRVGWSYVVVRYIDIEVDPVNKKDEECPLGSLGIAFGLVWREGISRSHVVTFNVATSVIAAMYRKQEAWWTKHGIPSS